MQVSYVSLGKRPANLDTGARLKDDGDRVVGEIRLVLPLIAAVRKCDVYACAVYGVDSLRQVFAETKRILTRMSAEDEGSDGILMRPNQKAVVGFGRCYCRLRSSKVRGCESGPNFLGAS